MFFLILRDEVEALTGTTLVAAVADVVGVGLFLAERVRRAVATAAAEEAFLLWASLVVRTEDLCCFCVFALVETELAVVMGKKLTSLPVVVVFLQV